MEKKKSKIKKKSKSRAVSKIVRFSEMCLSNNQLKVINSETPDLFIKERPIRGGKNAKYVEIGYIIAKLNEAFSPVGWDFEILNEGKEDLSPDTKAKGQVWVRGRLRVIDHKNGYESKKDQYGQHPIYQNVPVGDSYKSAASDSLKKCASLFGIASDVYWQDEVNDNKKKDNNKDDDKEKLKDYYQKILKSLKKFTNNAELLELKRKIESADIKYLSKEHKEDLINKINAKL